MNAPAGLDRRAPFRYNNGENTEGEAETVAEMTDTAQAAQDSALMEQALALAAEAAAAGEVPVGCVIALDGQIVGRGRNRRETARSALAHAEIEAIDEACRTLGGWRLWQCTLYVTLEPCPMCAGAIINARIPRVVYGASDPKAGACASVIRLFDLPWNHRPALTAGVQAEACSALLRQFFRALRRRRSGQDAEIPEAGTCLPPACDLTYPPAADHTDR